MQHPGRLHHRAPGWVEDGAAYHIRIRVDRAESLTADAGKKAQLVLEAARVYQQQERWFCRLILVMPDHLHAIIVFPREEPMSTCIQQWKRFLARLHGIRWQGGYFDHRLRSRKESDECWHYLRQNPMHAGLAKAEDEWPWLWQPDDATVPE